MRINKESLGELTLMAQGALGEVFRLEEHFRLPGVLGRQVYKEFAPLSEDLARSVVAVTAFRDSLNQWDRTWLDLYTAWPRAIVENAIGDVTGVIVPLIPRDFFCNMTDPDTGAAVMRMRDMAWLVTERQQRVAAHVDIPEMDREERLTLLAQLAYVITFLHDREWIFGDLTLSQAVFALNPLQMLLHHCDGAASFKDPNRRQYSTPFWEPPEFAIHDHDGRWPLQDGASDVYKLGLAVLRCMTPGRGAATSRSANGLSLELDQEGTDVVGRALSADPQSRPTARDLASYLNRAMSPRPPGQAPPDPTTLFPAEPLSAGGTGHAFLSYVREDSGKVDRLQRLLESAGISVWRDTASLWPGEDWRAKIRQAITDDALVVVACFSEHSASRTKTYMNEELVLAIDQLRQRRPGLPWLIPVRFDDSATPEHDLGGGRTLSSIQRADLFGNDYDQNAQRLIIAIRKILAVPA